MSESSGSRSDLGGGAVWVALGAVILFEALRMERFESMGATTYTYPGFVPGIIGAVIAGLGLVLMIRGWRARAIRTPVQSLVNRRVALAAALTLVYCLALLTRMHFALATALFVATFTFLFADQAHPAARRLLTAAASGAITAAVVLFFFQEIFLVRLP